MSTAKDITALRKNGQLTEAFDLATELLIAEPNNVWTKRAMGWVRYERLKAVAKGGVPEGFITEWSAIAELVADNAADETMLTNQALWQAVSCLFSLGENPKVGTVLSAVFTSIQSWTLEKPSDLYSALLRAFLKVGKTWNGLGAFLTWWQLSNLRSDDYLPGMTNDSKKIMSLAEQAYIAYAKQVLSDPKPDVVQTLIANLDTLHEQHPEYQYPPYYQAKLLVATGSKEEAMAALMPFARRKQNEFWLWDLLAELYDDKLEKGIACLCRAVTCQTQEKFLVNARVNLSYKLIQAEKLDEALTELVKSFKTRLDEGWHVNDSLVAIAEKLVANGSIVFKNNKDLYRQYRSLTDELLYADVHEQIGVVTFLNTDKKVAHFCVSRLVFGHFKYENSLSDIKPGDFVAVRLEQRTGKEGDYWVPLSVKQTQKLPSPEICKSFTGPVNRPTEKAFGFVGDVFVSPALLSGSDNGSIMNGLAICSFDKLKSKYGWKAVSGIIVKSNF